MGCSKCEEKRKALQAAKETRRAQQARQNPPASKVPVKPGGNVYTK